MGTNPNPAGLLTEPARTPRTGLARRTHEGVKRSPAPGAASGDLMRLFVAIAPPPTVLGEVDETAAARLLPRLERAARRHQEFRLAFAGAGAFPSAIRANVLWSGLSGDRGALGRLAESVAAGARRAGAPPPDKGRRFQPHLTLARCRMPADVTELVEALGDYQGPPWTADRVHLVRSRLGQTTLPRYTSLGDWPLRAIDTANPDLDPDPPADQP